ncbi:hypothetical protein PFICI_02496 [Pestalotiopsis fici W106-1]|uniref:Uncharacterized protein n=1 Tax=Pestalotiopsis fici (strain W106-1 / CGMCC3.15140) TaxID=1229662 RepID=W3XGW7_PESFW|nr:uncharacterized protein PFICI_02496 [Pestalotiopsis fici W106-1]ETS84471.1 hypothetical protein PFICI_02496 [Pestalotiopsis fici W106-1]
MYTSTLTVLLLVAARSVYAEGCATHTYGSCADGIVHWYDPDDGQICDPLDCGGGRAPVKTTVPCCAAYVGTASCNTEPSYMPCFTARSTSSSPISTAQDTQVTTTTTTNAAVTTTAANESGSGSQATVAPTGSSGSGSDVTPTVTTAATSTVTNGGSLTTSSTDSSSVSVATGAAGHVHHNPFMALVGAAFGVALL